MPFIGGVGYYTSAMLYIDFSNVVVELNDNLKLTKNTVFQTLGGPGNEVRQYDDTFVHSVNKPDKIDGVIVFKGGSSAYLTGCALIAPRRVTIDGNGAAIDAEGSYVHDAFANGNYSAVQMTMCIAPIIRNIVTTNSLSFGIQMSYCPGGLIENCKGMNTRHENGIQVTANAEHIRTFSDTDQTTWGGYRIVDCEAENCKNHGIGSYGAVGVQIINPKVSNCGNNDGVQQAGPAGGINVEHDGINKSRNYCAVITNPQVVNSYGFGLRTNCVGTQVSKGNVVNTKKPSGGVYPAKDVVPYIWGSAVFVQGAGTLETDGLNIDGSDRVGYRINAAGTLYPGLKVNGGIVTGCKERALYGISFDMAVVSPSTVISANGDSANSATIQTFTCEFNNAPGNTNQGLLDFSGIYVGNQGGVLSTLQVGTVVLRDVTGGENNANNNASAYHSIYIETCAKTLRAEKVNLSAINQKQLRVVKCLGLFGNIFANPDCISGYQTGAGFPKFDYTGIVAPNVQSTVIYGFGNGIPAFSVSASSAAGPGVSTRDVAVNGLYPGDVVNAGFNKPLQGCLLDAEVTANNTVTVTWRNFGSSAVSYTLGGVVSVRGTRVLGN